MQARTILVAVAAMLLATGAVQADVFNMGSGLTSLTFVTVGNPGNDPDVNLDFYGNPLGSVGYTYQMGMYDVTAAQYCQFLNAVATTSDPYGLYNASMSGGPGSTHCGINQTGRPGIYSYNTTSGYSVNNGNFPVNYITWGDAARFCNWLTNGQPTTGAENLTTTENGSYYLNGAVTQTALSAVTRTGSAKYVIPTENEWYKAAYYDPTLYGCAGWYWQYPTKSNTAPSNVLSSTGTNNANFYNTTYPGIYTDHTNFLTVVGAFADSPSPYGTFDMGGDVWEWNEANFLYTASPCRGLRGGSFCFYNGGLAAAFLYSGNPTWGVTGLGGGGDLGFRVAELPEPATMAILALGGLALLRVRKQ